MAVLVIGGKQTTSGGAVDSVNGETGVVVLTTGDLTEDADHNYVTDAEKTTISNTSGINTGDEDTSSIQAKRPLKTVDGFSLEGNGNVSIPKGRLVGYYFSQNNTPQSSNSTTGVTYETLVEAADPNKEYQIFVFASLSHDATNTRAFLDIKDFGVSLLPERYEAEPKEDDNRAWEMAMANISPQDPPNNQFQIQVDFGSTSSWSITTVYFMQILFFEID